MNSLAVRVAAGSVARRPILSHLDELARSWANRYSYPIDLHEEPKVVSRSPSPTSTRRSRTVTAFDEAISEAADRLQEALAGRILRRDDIPASSQAKDAQPPYSAPYLFLTNFRHACGIRPNSTRNPCHAESVYQEPVR